MDHEQLTAVYEAAVALQRSSPLMTGRPMVAVGEAELNALFGALRAIPIQQQQYVPKDGETVVNWVGLPGTLPPLPFPPKPSNSQSGS